MQKQTASTKQPATKPTVATETNAKKTKAKHIAASQIAGQQIAVGVANEARKHTTNHACPIKLVHSKTGETKSFGSVTAARGFLLCKKWEYYENLRKGTLIRSWTVTVDESLVSEPGGVSSEETEDEDDDDDDEEEDEDDDDDDEEEDDKEDDEEDEDEEVESNDEPAASLDAVSKRKGAVQNVSRSRPVEQVNLKTGKVVKTFSGPGNANRDFGKKATHATIFHVLSGRQSHGLGFGWRYATGTTPHHVKTKRTGRPPTLKPPFRKEGGARVGASQKLKVELPRLKRPVVRPTADVSKQALAAHTIHGSTQPVLCKSVVVPREPTEWFATTDEAVIWLKVTKYKFYESLKSNVPCNGYRLFRGVPRPVRFKPSGKKVPSKLPAPISTKPLSRRKLQALRKTIAAAALTTAAAAGKRALKRKLNAWSSTPGSGAGGKLKRSVAVLKPGVLCKSVVVPREPTEWFATTDEAVIWLKVTKYKFYESLKSNVPCNGYRLFRGVPRPVRFKPSGKRSAGKLAKLIKPLPRPVGFKPSAKSDAASSRAGYDPGAGSAEKKAKRAAYDKARGSARGSKRKHMSDQANSAQRPQSVSKARCAFSTEICTQRCHWFPRLLA
jgi:hypothetical protein